MKYTLQKHQRYHSKLARERLFTSSIYFLFLGGKVVSILPGTENVDSAKTLFGLTLCEGMHGPRAMLQVYIFKITSFQ